MNGSTAFHLKQIMSAEHLSLTQTAKQIGISPASMRKVLKDATMSQAVMFKINRFIDDHQAIIATKPGELPQATEAPAKETKAPAKKAAAKKPAEKAKKTTTKKTTPTAKKAASKPAKAETQTKAAPAKAKTKTTPAKANSTQTKATPAKAKPNSAQTKATPAKAATSAVQTNLSLAETKPTPKPASRRQKLNKNKAKRGFTIHQIDGEPIVPEAERQTDQRLNQTRPTPQPATETQQAVEERAAKLAQAGVGSMNPKPVTKQEQPKSQAKQSQAKSQDKPATKQEQPKTQAKQEPAKSQDKPAIKQEQSKSQAKQEQARSQAKPATKQEQPKSQAKQEPAKSQDKPVSKQEQPKTQAKQEPAKSQDKPAAKQEQPTQAAPANQQAQPAPAVQPTSKVAVTITVPEATHPAAEAEVSQPEPTTIDPLHKKTQTLQLFVDESFVHGNDYQRSMFIGVTVVDQDDAHALDQFADTLYPFGWQPGDEVKARGKNHDQIAAMLTQSHGEHAANFVAFSPQSDTGNFALGFGVLYPYLATILRVLKQIDNLPNKIRIALDRRNELEDEQLAVAARMLNAYVKAQTGKDVMFMLRTSDSKSTIGIQYSDFSAHAALTFTEAQLADCGITRLPDLGSIVGDQITLFSMIGLQKYMLDDRSVVQQQASYKNPVLSAAERLLRLSNKATGLTQVPDETLTQAKLVINQLLQITPSSVNGAINKMPFQTWYDMVARAAALLHYTDATLPNFEIDPDAMQIAQDALNNIANLLASAK